MKKIIFLLLMIIAFNYSLLLANSNNSTGIIDGNPEQVSMLLYTSKFAKQFNLPSDKSQQLDAGLEAIQFVIVKENTDENPTYDCRFNLYVDNNLNIFYPNNDAGDLAGYLRTESLVQASLADSNITINLSLTNPQNYTQKIYIASQKNITQHHISLPDSFYSPAYLAFHKNIFTNLSFISFSAQCPTLLSNTSGSQILITRSNILKDYSPKISGFSNKYYYTFKIPQQIIQWDYLKKAMENSNYTILLNGDHLYDSL